MRQAIVALKVPKMSGVYEDYEDSLPRPRGRSGPRSRARGRGVNIVPEQEAADEPEPPKLTRHRWFEPERVPATERAQAVVDDVLNQVQNYEKYFALRQRARKKVDQELFEATVTALISDLMFNQISGEPPGIAITRSKKKLGRRSRYASPVMGKTLPTILDRLSSPEMDFLRQEVGQQEYFKDNRSTTIYPAERLLSRIRDRDLSLADLGTKEIFETIVLKRPKNGPFDKGGKIEYDDTPVTIRYRQEMERINAYLAAVEIDFDETALVEDRTVDLTSRRLRRVFTNGSFECGGRLFGGFWQNLKKVERADGLLMDEQSVRTLDYSQMALRIAYGVVGHDPPEGDGYVLPDLEEYRAAVKIVFNSMLSSDRRLTRAPKGTREYLPRVVPFLFVLRRLEEHHAGLLPLFYTGAGHRLQFIESQIMVQLLLRLQDNGIAALPIHDAVIVAQSLVAKTRNIMERVFKEETGIDAIVEAE